MSINKCCFFGLHHYEVKDELQVTIGNETPANVAGVNYVCVCKNCGKIKSTFVPTNADYLEEGRGVRTNK